MSDETKCRVCGDSGWMPSELGGSVPCGCGAPRMFLGGVFVSTPPTTDPRERGEDAWTIVRKALLDACAVDRNPLHKYEHVSARLDAIAAQCADRVLALPAPARGVTVTEAMVEAGARAEFAYFTKSERVIYATWEQAPDALKDDFRQAARAVLTAARTPDAEGGA